MDRGRYGDIVKKNIYLFMDVKIWKKGNVKLYFIICIIFKKIGNLDWLIYLLCCVY